MFYMDLLYVSCKGNKNPTLPCITIRRQCRAIKFDRVWG